MITKKERIYIRVTEKQKVKLQEMAKADNRSLSNYILTVIESHIERGEKMKLVEYNEGKARNLIEGSLGDIVQWLKDNPDKYEWINDNEKHDPSFDGELTEMPDLSNIETLRDLEYELDKIDLWWWRLAIE